MDVLYSPTLQNLHINLCMHTEVLRFITPLFSLMSKEKQNMSPFLNLRKVKIAANFESEEITEFVDIINSQKHLEILEVSSSVLPRPFCIRRCYSSHKEIFQAVMNCFQKPNFQCLSLNLLHVKVSTLFDIQYHLLNSTANRKQQLVVSNLMVHDFDNEGRKGVVYTSERTCTKSLSVINCCLLDSSTAEKIIMRPFPGGDIASEILLYPGIQELTLELDHHGMFNCCLDRADICKLVTALEEGTGKLQLLHLSGTNLASVIVDASPLFGALFHLPHLSEQ